MKNYISILTVVLIGLCGTIFVSCVNNSLEPTTDMDLYDMSIAPSGFSWYNFSDSLLEKSDASGHSQPYLRTRYNNTAASMQDSNGKITPGLSFPDHSLIVKELFETQSSRSAFAIMYKDEGHKLADSTGWVWAILAQDGTVMVSATEKGTTCIHCHSQQGNIDNTLMTKYHDE